ncbi:MAG: M81 family metallopeptidase [Burkholderiaceae bacterium]
MAFRVLTALFGHESNAFARLPATRQNFADYLLAFGDDIPAAISGATIEPSGVEQAAKDYQWDLVRTVVAWATPSGPVADDAWRAASEAILNAARDQGPFDGALICLHGAMATVHSPDGEGDLLQALRKLLGPTVPVAITLDLHANLTTRMLASVDIVTAYRTYPHIDQVATAQRAAAVLQRTMLGEVQPVCHLARRDMLIGLDHGRTTVANPMTKLLKRADELEQSDNQVLVVSIQSGFSPADLAEAGPSVCVTTDNAADHGQAIADEFMAYAWETRHCDSNNYLNTAETVTALRDLLQQAPTDGSIDDGPIADGPIVVADYSDNPGSGSYGDSTYLLSALLDAGFTNASFGTLCDPEAAAELAGKLIGSTHTITIGGKVDPRFGPPITVTGVVTRVTDGTYVAQSPRWKGVTHRLGTTVVFTVGGMEIIIASNRIQLTELEAFTHAGIDPRKRSIVVVKSMQHFRAGFAPIASHILICDAGALSSNDISQLPYTRLRRPVFPLDLD